MNVTLGTLLTLGSVIGNGALPMLKLGNTSILSLTNISTFDCGELVPPDATLSFVELAQKYGHPVEQYEVITEDGYKLKVFRMRGKRKALPILLMHGVLASSYAWLIRGNTSLSITLANEGYDVWIGNERGNEFSRGHVSAAVESNPAAYWNFTFNEHGKFDFAATIDLVLNKTGAKKLNAIGHSQGTTIFYVLCSTRPEYNDKINLFTSLAPIAYLHHTPPPVSTLIESAPLLYAITTALKIYELFSENSLIVQGGKFICPVPVLGYSVCALGVIFPLAGFDPPELDPCFLRVFIRHSPMPTSTKNLYHFAQVGLRKKFAHFDYGTDGNKIAYNSSTPPDYDLKKITTKVALTVATNDHLSTIDDVAILRAQLSNIVSYRIVPRPECNHLDFVIGKNTPIYLNPHIFDLLRTYGDN